MKKILIIAGAGFAFLVALIAGAGGWFWYHSSGRADAAKIEESKLDEAYWKPLRADLASQALDECPSFRGIGDAREKGATNFRTIAAASPPVIGIDFSTRDDAAELLRVIKGINAVRLDAKLKPLGVFLSINDLKEGAAISPGFTMAFSQIGYRVHKVSEGRDKRGLLLEFPNMPEVGKAVNAEYVKRVGPVVVDAFRQAMPNALVAAIVASCAVPFVVEAAAQPDIADLIKKAQAEKTAKAAAEAPAPSADATQAPTPTPAPIPAPAAPQPAVAAAAPAPVAKVSAPAAPVAVAPTPAPAVTAKPADPAPPKHAAAAPTAVKKPETPKQTVAATAPRPAPRALTPEERELEAMRQAAKF